MREVNSIGDKVLAEALAALEAVEPRSSSLDDFLDNGLQHPELRRTVSNLLFAYFRHKKAIDGAIAHFAAKPPRPQLRRLLSAALTQMFFQTRIASESAANIAVEYAKNTFGKFEANFVNALLRRILAEPERVTAAIEAEAILPDAILKRWKMRFQQSELKELSALFQTPADFTFRAERDFVPSFVGQRECAGFGAFRFFIADSPAELLESAALREGRIYIQDPATSLAPSLPDYAGVKRVLDLCAAPGGKSLMLGERMAPDAVLVAADRSARRQEMTRANFELRRLPYQVVTAEPADLCGAFDLVLADVPCSNTGVFRRRPDALWRFSGGDLAKVMQLQRSILESAADLTEPGGQLVYSTCSIEPEENTRQIAAFLERHKEFSLITERQLLPTMEHDGAFSALLRRR